MQHIDHATFHKGRITTAELDHFRNSTVINPSFDAFVVHGSAVEKHSVEHSIDQITDCSGKNDRHRNDQIIRLPFFQPFTEKINHKTDERNSYDHKEVFPE